MKVVQRREALRIASSYRTIDLFAFERKRTYERMREIWKQRAIAEARESNLATWQQRWVQETKRRWTHGLIPSISEWAKREHGEVNFYLTQFLTGKEYFIT